MTFLEALYGSQYQEIANRGGDTSKGRFNGNIFLSVLFFLLLVIAFMLAIRIIPGFEKTVNRSIRNWFGSAGGRSIGKLMAIPLMAILYTGILLTVGTKKKYSEIISRFMLCPEEDRKKANKIILIRFFMLLAIVLVLMLGGKFL